MSKAFAKGVSLLVAFVKVKYRQCTTLNRSLRLRTQILGQKLIMRTPTPSPPLFAFAFVMGAIAEEQYRDMS
jgi:hypothetical protein